MNFDHVGFVWVPTQYLDPALGTVVDFVVEAVDAEAVLRGELGSAHLAGNRLALSTVIKGHVSLHGLFPISLRVRAFLRKKITYKFELLNIPNNVILLAFNSTYTLFVPATRCGQWGHLWYTLPECTKFMCLALSRVLLKVTLQLHTLWSTLQLST